MKSEPIHVISLGAGVQSSTMALMATHGEITPLPIAAIFADTQAEPPSVYKWLDWLEPLLPFPIYRVTKGSLTEHALRSGETAEGSTWVNASIPAFVKQDNGQIGPLLRGCTRDFKVRPVRKKIRQLAQPPPGTTDIYAIQWIGISLDEVYRMKDCPEPWMRHRWPLVDLRMSRHDCFRWMEAHGYPKPPRSACTFCPYHNNTEWRRLRDDEPEAFQHAIQFERRMHANNHLRATGKGMPYLHRDCVPLDQVDLSTEHDQGQTDLFSNECEGMCGM